MEGTQRFIRSKVRAQGLFAEALPRQAADLPETLSLSFGSPLSVTRLAS